MNESDKSVGRRLVELIGRSESDKTTNAAGQAGRVPVGAEVLPTSQPVPAAPSAVEEVKRLWNRDCGEIRTWYSLALDLAKRLDSAEAECDWYISETKNGIEIIREKEAALKRKDGLLREAIPQLIGEPGIHQTTLRERIQRELNNEDD